MIKDKLIEVLKKMENYSWSLYFFKKDKRNKQQPFSAYKKRFKKEEQFYTYIQGLLNCINTVQFSKIESIEKYNGMNANITCNFIELSNCLIEKQWGNFFESIKNAADEPFKNKIIGYVICGEPPNDENKPITFMKFSCPIITIKNNKIITLIETPEQELDIFIDKCYKLFWIVDAFVYENNFYTFNNNFESIFDIDKAVQNIKDAVIDRILKEDLINNIEEFKSYSKSYKAPKTFIAFDEERFNSLLSAENREEILQSYKLTVNKENKIIIESEEDFKNFIKYICLKIICEKGTGNLFNVHSAKKEEK